MSLDCLIIGGHHGSYRIDERSRWMNAQSQASPDEPPDLAYAGMSGELVNLDGRWMEAFELINHLHQGEADWTIQRPGVGGPNAACLALAAYLRRRGWRTGWVNSFDHHLGTLARLLVDEDPTVTCITTTFLMHPGGVVDAVQFIREHNADTKIVVGGPLLWSQHRYSTPKAFRSLLSFMDADYYVVDPEGEATLERLLTALRDGRSVREVPNLFWPERAGQEAGQSALVPENNPMEELAVDWSLFSRAELGRAIVMRTALSCALKCAFCPYPVKMGKLRTQAVEQLEVELRQLDRLGVEYINFVDDTYNIPAARFNRILRMMVDNDFSFRWISFLRVASVKDKATFKLASDSGCQMVFLGIESANPTVLANMAKGCSMDGYRSGIEELNKHGILSMATFMVGFPGETAGTIRDNIRFIEEVRPPLYHAYPWCYVSGTPVENDADRYDLKGSRYYYAHSTMNGTAAHVATEAMLRGVRSSCWIPSTGFDCWSLSYLQSKGMTTDGFLRLCRAIRDLIVSNPGHMDSQPRTNAISARAGEFLQAHSLPDRRRDAGSMDRASIVDQVRSVTATLTPSDVHPDDGRLQGTWLEKANERLHGTSPGHATATMSVPNEWKGCTELGITERVMQNARKEHWKDMDSIFPVAENAE